MKPSFLRNLVVFFGNHRLQKINAPMTTQTTEPAFDFISKLPSELFQNHILNSLPFQTETDILQFIQYSSVSKLFKSNILKLLPTLVEKNINNSTWIKSQYAVGAIIEFQKELKPFFLEYLNSSCQNFSNEMLDNFAHIDSDFRKIIDDKIEIIPSTEFKPNSENCFRAINYLLRRKFTQNDSWEYGVLCHSGRLVYDEVLFWSKTEISANFIKLIFNDSCVFGPNTLEYFIRFLFLESDLMPKKQALALPAFQEVLSKQNYDSYFTRCLARLMNKYGIFMQGTEGFLKMKELMEKKIISGHITDVATKTDFYNAQMKWIDTNPKPFP